MNIKRILTTVIGLPFVIIILTFGSKYLIDVLIAIVAIMTIHEFYKAFRKKAHPIEWLGYLSAILIAFIHCISPNIVVKVIGALIPITMLILFLHVIITNGKINITDIAITFFGICYIVLFIMFVPIIREMENGNLLIWCLFIAAWGTDIFAYVFGKTMGKHKFSKISPNKTIEGCIGGIIGSTVIMVIYIWVCNICFMQNFNYLLTILIAIVLSVISQIGDFSASSIKRYVGIKDFSNLIPGHGGMLDRIDSVIFIAPFAYFLLMLI